MLMIIIIFGSLTYRNIRGTIVLAEQQADRRLIRMIFSQVILLFIDTILLGGYQTYNTITSGMMKNQDRLLKEYLAYAIISTMATFYHVIC
ncbi:unnamed protein product [Adineta ricciae]|uniref:Uncharacterized protein n=1 Tax=Adineta ricciae TaxID=249248 RepID=A0A815V4D5_ADIRI|nr:unnamed protein product [Adineta ricciae]